MGAVQRRVVLGALVVLVLGQLAQAGEYVDASGFSFTYPDGWVAVNRAAMSNEPIPEVIQKWVEEYNVDLNRVAMVLVRNSGEGFLDSINFLVSNEPLEVSDTSAKQLAAQIFLKLQSDGVTIDGLRPRVLNYGPHKVVCLDYDPHVPGVPYTLRQRQVFIPGGDKTYIVTLLARAISFDKHARTLDAILASFQAPAPIAKKFDWGQVGRSAVIWGVIGGALGGLVGGAMWLARKLKPPGKSTDENPATSGAGAV